MRSFKQPYNPLRLYKARQRRYEQRWQDREDFLARKAQSEATAEELESGEVRAAFEEYVEEMN